MASGIPLRLKEGDPAPSFSSLDQEGNVVSSAQLRGRRFVLFFYPKDNTPGCTREACSFRDTGSRLCEAGVEVLGASPDGTASHRKFAAKFQLPFRLLVDEERTLCRAYGVWGRKSFMGRSFDGVHRTTFLIGPDGRIERIWEKVKPDGHAEEVLAAIEALDKAGQVRAKARGFTKNPRRSKT